MGSPHRPRFVKQLDGLYPTFGGVKSRQSFDGYDCGCASAAMAGDRGTLGKTRVSATRIRELTGDRDGGTNLTQQSAALMKLGITLTVTRGAPIKDLDDALFHGRGASVSGSSVGTYGTRWSASPTFKGNHQWFINQGHQWHGSEDSRWAEEYLIYDPLGDGRRSGIVQSPFWLPRAYLLKFLANLVLDPRSGRELGPGRAYMGLTRDTEPHAHLHYGGHRLTDPFPDHMTAYNANPSRRINVRTAPDTSARITSTLPVGGGFLAYQSASGDEVSGSRTWYGNHDGNRWIHSSGLKGKGGK